MRLDKFEIMKRVRHIADNTTDKCATADLENLLKILKETSGIDCAFGPKAYDDISLRTRVLVNNKNYNSLVHESEVL